MALKSHYGHPDDRGWAVTHVSHYAAAHPWEDWAETFAHYLHIRDTLQTSAAFGVSVAGPDIALRKSARLSATPREHPDSFDALVDTWLPFTLALNQINRSMGKDDLYPFVLVPAVIEKLRQVHDLVGHPADVGQ